MIYSSIINSVTRVLLVEHSYSVPGIRACPNRIEIENRKSKGKQAGLVQTCSPSFFRFPKITRSTACLMYHAACNVEFQPFNRSYSQLAFFFFNKNVEKRQL